MKLFIFILVFFGLISGAYLLTPKSNNNDAVKPNSQNHRNWISPEPPSTLPPVRPLETKSPKPASTLPPTRHNG